MAQYTFDPNQHPAGSLPSGWTEYGFSGKATIQNDPTFGNYLRVNNQNTPTFDGMVVWTELGVIDSTQWPLEIVARVRWSNSDISWPGPLYADPSTWNGYGAVLVDRNDVVRLNRADAASWVSVAQTDVGAVVEGEVWWIKWRIESGGRHLIKAWKDGNAEPAGWHIGVIDTTYSSGYIGVEIQRFGQNHYFWLGVGTNGDPAPTSAGGGQQTITMDVVLSAAAGAFAGNTQLVNVGAVTASLPGSAFSLSNVQIDSLSISAQLQTGSLSVLFEAIIEAAVSAKLPAGNIAGALQGIVLLDGSLVGRAGSLLVLLTDQQKIDLSVSLAAQAGSLAASLAQILEASLSGKFPAGCVQGATAFILPASAAMQALAGALQVQGAQVLSAEATFQGSEAALLAHAVPVVVASVSGQLAAGTLLVVAGDVAKLGDFSAALGRALKLSVAVKNVLSGRINSPGVTLQVE